MVNSLNNSIHKVLFIVGPTAVGKSDIAIQTAKALDGEIISADSMQIYKGMTIGTAQPTTKEKKGIKHHLIGFLPVSKNYSIFNYRQSVLQQIQKIIKKGKTPIVVGGSGLYISAVIDGISPQPKGSVKLRKRFSLQKKKYGLNYLYQRLKRIDSKRAAEIHPNDERRIVRALEIYDQSGKTFTEWRNRRISLEQCGYRSVVVGLTMDRERLYKKINLRVLSMVKAGWVKEARKLRKKKQSTTAKQAMGYNELFLHIKGKLSLEDAVIEIQKNTRHFAKRQWTWFNRMNYVRWLDVTKSRSNKVSKQIEGIWKESF